MNKNEALSQLVRNLDYCAMLEREGLIDLNDINTLMPSCFVSMAKSSDISFVYMGPSVLSALEMTIEDVIAAGPTLSAQMGDNVSLMHLSRALRSFRQHRDRTEVFCNMPKLRFHPQKPFSPYLWAAKFYQDTNLLLTFAQPVEESGLNTTIEGIVDVRYRYFNDRYHQFKALTKREREILTHTAQGASSKEISERLCISKFTVSTHRQNIIQKVGSNRLSDLVKFAIAFGLIELR